MLSHGATPIIDLRTRGASIELLLNGGKAVWFRSPAIPGLPSLMGTRTTEEDVGNGPEKFFEVGIPVRDVDDMAGNASAGWTTMHGFFRLVLEWSEGLEAWSVGKFASSGTTSETLDGTACTVYWCRSIHPIDSATKTGNLTARNSGGDSRNNPLIGVCVDGVLQVMPRASYSMPEDAALMQADLRALGWAGATVTASSVADWAVIIPDVSLSSFNAASYVSWPVWTAYDPMSGLPMSIWSYEFSGEYINAAGARTSVAHQFCRLGITPLKL